MNLVGERTGRDASDSTLPGGYVYHVHARASQLLFCDLLVQHVEPTLLYLSAYFMARCGTKWLEDANQRHMDIYEWWVNKTSISQARVYPFLWRI